MQEFSGGLLEGHPGRVVLWAFAQGGNSSVVECDLAKVEVAGSNPVSRSIYYFRRGPLHPG